MKVNAIDLFCGIGGLTHGVRRAGINVIAGVDVDDTCRYAYETNNDAVFIHKSVSDISSTALNDLYPKSEYKVLMGCAPCQAFSHHNKNKKNRTQHKSWGLLNDFKDHIVNIMPDIVSMENVPTLEKQDIFVLFRKTLEQLGYFVTHKVVNSADYGVPQRRRRLLLLASRLGVIDFISPTNEGLHITLRDAIGHLPPLISGESCNDDPLHVSSKLSNLNNHRIRASKPGGTWRDWPDELLPECYQKETGKTYATVYGRMKWDEVSPTLTTQFNRYGTGRYGHPEQDRGLSLREGAILQSFPVTYKFAVDGDFSITNIAKQIGNAVPVKLGEIIGASIIKHIKGVKSDGKT